MDLKTLYRQVIMDHYKNPKNKGLKNEAPYHLVHLTNPSCGDDMRVEIIVSMVRLSMFVRRERDALFVYPLLL